MSNSIRSFFEENGYYHAPGVFSTMEIGALEEDFDHIVAQLNASGEDVNARWQGEHLKNQMKPGLCVSEPIVTVVPGRTLKSGTAGPAVTHYQGTVSRRSMVVRDRRARRVGADH